MNTHFKALKLFFRFLPWCWASMSGAIFLPIGLILLSAADFSPDNGLPYLAIIIGIIEHYRCSYLAAASGEEF